MPFRLTSLLFGFVAAMFMDCESSAVNAQAPGGTNQTADASDDATASLPEFQPTLRDGMTSDQQMQAVRSILGNLEEERFFKPSVVSPFVFELKPLSKLGNGGQRQRLDVWFVAHGKLDDIEEKKLMDDLTGPEAKQTPGLPEIARALTEAEMKARDLKFGDQPDGSGRAYGIMGANVLDKAFVTGVTSSRYRKTDDSIELFLRLSPSLFDDADFPARWYPISKADDGALQLGKANPYTDLAALIKVTKLAGVEDGLFVEVHVVYAEPFGWFEGRNLLRSKLPPVLQDSVRKFRRKLAQ
ncbi:MAG TPA: hypothetical protein DDZ51_06930 [Planctomycetaceae bacterium]|nr:hypothetical protein [Planctomycetaceae bacterium]